MSVENYVPEIISFLAGMGSGSLLTIRITRKSRDNIKGNSVDQRRATADGDIVGGDKKNITNRY